MLLLFTTFQVEAASLNFSQVSFPGSVATIPLGINSSGDIVGYYDSSGFLRDFLGVYTSVCYSKVAHGVCTLSEASQAINDLGQIVGYYIASNFHGYLYSDGGFSLLDFPGAYATIPYGINNSGEVVGTYYGTLPGTSAATGHGFLDTGGVFQTIDFPGADLTDALSINSQGDVVGAYRDSLSHQHAFFRDSFGFYSSFDFPGATVTSAYAINDEGQIVGAYDDANKVEHAFLRNVDGTFLSFDYPGAVATAAQGINNNGVIVGQYYPTPSSPLGFEATVVPEGNSFSLVVAGLVLLGIFALSGSAKGRSPNIS
jgi:probable HAF family extracellular repeat protein